MIFINSVNKKCHVLLLVYSNLHLFSEMMHWFLINDFFCCETCQIVWEIISISYQQLFKLINRSHRTTINEKRNPNRQKYRAICGAKSRGSKYPKKVQVAMSFPVKNVPLKVSLIGLFSYFMQGTLLLSILTKTTCKNKHRPLN